MSRNLMKNERPTPVVEDLAGTQIKLARWLSELFQNEYQVEEITIPTATGMSNVTLIFTMNWKNRSNKIKKTKCVARLQPQGLQTVFPNYDLELQYRIMDTLGEKSSLPVPNLLGLEKKDNVLGVPFYIMEYHPGLIPSDIPPYHMGGWLKEETNETQRKDLWNATTDVLISLHKLDYKKIGFSDLISEEQTPLNQQLSYWKNYHVWALDGKVNNICDEALNWLLENQPNNESTVLCWGDARISNIIYEDSLDKVVAVLDWEMASLGNPVQDIAWFNYMDSCFSEGLGCSRLPGFPTYRETLSRWEKGSGYSAKDYDYYTIFAGLRFSLLLSRIMMITDQQDKADETFASKMLKKRMKDVITDI